MQKQLRLGFIISRLPDVCILRLLLVGGLSCTWSSMGIPLPHILVLIYVVMQSLKGWPLIAVLCWELTIGMAVWTPYTRERGGAARCLHTNAGDPGLIMASQNRVKPDYCWSNIELSLQHIYSYCSDCLLRYRSSTPCYLLCQYCRRYAVWMLLFWLHLWLLLQLLPKGNKENSRR